MKLTPIEAARLTINGDDSRWDEINEVIVFGTAREIQEFIYNIDTRDHSHWYKRVTVALNIRLAEDAAKTAEKMAHQNERLVDESVSLTTLTKQLRFWTIALVATAIIQIAIMVVDYLKHK
jgi:hypothetical protein